MGRSRIHRKRFPCGHQGKGQVCQHCEQEKAQAQQAAAEAAKRRRDRHEWQARFADDPIDLTGLPRQIVEKARHVIQALDQGTPYHQLGGVRFRHDRTVIRIPLTPHYRMLCDEVEGRFIPRVVMSHESYNPVARNKKR